MRPAAGTVEARLLREAVHLPEPGPFVTAGAPRAGSCAIAEGRSASGAAGLARLTTCSFCRSVSKSSDGPM